MTNLAVKPLAVPQGQQFAVIAADRSHGPVAVLSVPAVQGDVRRRQEFRLNLGREVEIFLVSPELRVTQVV